MGFPKDLRMKIIHMRKTMTVRQITETLKKYDNVGVSKSTLYRILKTPITATHHRKRKARKVRDIHIKLIDDCMTTNPERSAAHLQKILVDEVGLKLSISHIKQIRRNLGWTQENTRYCQMIRDVNKPKRLMWCLNSLQAKDQFEDVIFRRVFHSIGKRSPTNIPKDRDT